MARAKRFIHNNNTNAICYYRYSSDAQRECSIEQQRKEAIEYCKQKGYHIIKEYSDKAMSGTREDRPQFQLMLNEVQKLKPGYLIVWKTDRLSRDRIDAVLAKHKMRENGVAIEYVAEKLPEDEAERVLIEGIEEALAEHFVIQHSKNVLRGLNHNAENCLYNGHKLLGYSGQPNEQYKIDEKTAPIVRKIFDDFTSGKKMGEIANELNEMGCKTTRNKEFTEKALWHILQNRAYMGEYKYGEFVKPGGMPVIIKEEQFNKAQSIMAAGKHGNRGRKIKTKENVEFWLTGKLVCGICGSAFSGTGGTSHTGAVHYYYNCTTHKKSSKLCAKKNIRKELLEDTVLYALGSMLCDFRNRILISYNVYKKYLKEYVPDDSRERVLKKEIKDIDSKLENVMKAIEAGIFNETTQQRMIDLENQRKIMKDQLAEDIARRDNTLKFIDVYTYLNKYAGLLSEKDGKNKLLYGLVDSIIVYDDSVELRMYYSVDNRKQSFDTTQRLRQRSQELRQTSETISPSEELWDNTEIAKMFDMIQDEFEVQIQVLEDDMGRKVVTDMFEDMYKKLDKMYNEAFKPKIEEVVNECFF